MSSEQYTENIAIRVTEDTEEAVERYAEENGLNKSSAARELLREGMWEKRISPYTRGSAGQGGDFKTTMIAILVVGLVGFAGILGFVIGSVGI
jgi:hypothetical protein